MLRDEFEFIGQGTHALRFVRRSGFLTRQGRVPRHHRSNRAAPTMRYECVIFFATVNDTVFTYDVADLDKRYDGAGERGTAVSKDE